jgi:hypothetical protein
MNFEQALVEWLGRAQSIVDRGAIMPSKLSIDPKGKKYIRIMQRDANETREEYGSAFCFISKENGDVLKAAGWKTPAKHARGNIYKVGQEGVGAYGAHYLN